MEAGARQADQVRSPQTSAPLAHAAIPNLRREYAVPLSTAQAAAATDAATLSPESVRQAQSHARVKAAPNLLSDYVALFKARVTLLVVITAWAGFYLGSVRSGISSIHIWLLETL